MLSATAIKVNPKYIENPFSISEFLEFIDDILKENAPLNGVYKATNRLRAVELAKGILERNMNFKLTDSLVQLLKKPKTIKLVLITEPWSIDTANIIEGKRGTRNNQNIVTPERPTPSTRLREREKDITTRK
jgi:hypothetical protein